MKKHTFLMAVFLLIACSARAQLISGGIAGGVNTGSVKISDLDTAFEGVIEGSGISGFELGLYAKMRLGPFYVRPQAMYNFRKGEVEDNNSQKTDFKMHKLEVPVFIGFRILGPVSIEAAPVYNYIISITDHYDNRDVTIARSGLGWRAGVCVDLGVVFVNANYAGVTYTSSDSNKATFKEPYKITLGVGIRLGGSDSDDD